MTVTLCDKDTVPQDEISMIRHLIYQPDESTLRQRENEYMKHLMWMLRDSVSQSDRDHFLLVNRENDTHRKKVQNRLQKLDIFNLEEMAQEFKVNFTHLDLSFKRSRDALEWLKKGDGPDDDESFDGYERNLLEPCNRRWAFLGEMDELSHYFAIRASNRHVFRRRIKDFNYVVTVTEDIPLYTTRYLKALVDLPDEEAYQKVATTFIMGFTV